MLEHPKALASVSSFSGLSSMPTPGSGVWVSTYDNLSIASVLVQKGKETALAARVQERYGIYLSQALSRSNGGGLAFIATGPQSWLATAEQSNHTFSVSLRQALGDFASITDQSDAYAVLRLAGPRVRDTLAKLVAIDVHPRVFPVGMAVVTVAAHIGVTLWRIADEPDGASAFEIAFYRSMAGSFWHLLCESAAEFGLASSGAEPPQASRLRSVAPGSLT